MVDTFLRKLLDGHESGGKGIYKNHRFAPLGRPEKTRDLRKMKLADARGQSDTIKKAVPLVIQGDTRYPRARRQGNIRKDTFCVGRSACHGTS